MSSEPYPIPAAAARAEIRVVNSRFIGSAEYTPSVEAARAYIAQVRAEFSDARHHAYAYLVGYGSSVTAGMSDDGEPSGTAGRPMLAIVRGSGLGDVTVVVTRYFGGTLLGTGGLVHAYGDATRAVLESVPRTERIEKRTLLVCVAYADYTPVCQVLERYQGTIVEEDFATDVTLTITLPTQQRDACIAELTSLTAGQAEIAEVAEE
jgi:uncharacterized YigZ family protein